jgi:hypothetical protein
VARLITQPQEYINDHDDPEGDHRVQASGHALQYAEQRTEVEVVRPDAGDDDAVPVEPLNEIAIKQLEPSGIADD